MSCQGPKEWGRGPKGRVGWALSGGFPQLLCDPSPSLIAVKQCQTIEKDGKRLVQ